MGNRSGAAGRPVNSLWWRNPYCFYCGCKVRKRGSGRGHIPPDRGTVEHIPPLWIARIGKLKTRRVLACYACNKAEDARVRALFPRYFFQLWNGGTLPRERKMLLPGNNP